MMPTMSATLNTNEKFVTDDHYQLFYKKTLFSNTLTVDESIEFLDTLNIPSLMSATFSIIAEKKPNYETLFDLSLMRESNQEELDFLYSIRKKSMTKLIIKK